jgi:hypothetical protein
MKLGHSELSAMLPMFGAAAKAKGLRWGKARSHSAAKYAGIHLISKNSPEIALRIMEYTGKRCDERQAHPRLSGTGG